MYSMSSGGERAMFCLIVVVKNNKERSTGHSSVGAGRSGQLCLSVLFHRLLCFVLLAGELKNFKIFSAFPFAFTEKAVVHFSVPIFSVDL